MVGLRERAAEGLQVGDAFSTTTFTKTTYSVFICAFYCSYGQLQRIFDVSCLDDNTDCR